MKRIDILKKLNKTLSPDKVDFSSIDSEIDALKKKLQEKVYIETIDDVGRKLKQFQKSLDLTPLTKEIEAIRNLFTERTKELEASLKDKSAELITATEVRNKERVETLRNEISTLKVALTSLSSSRVKDLEGLIERIKEAKSIEGKLNDAVNKLSLDINARYTKDEAKQAVRDTQELIDTLRTELLNKLNRGGSANQQINVNSSVMSTRYADFNFLSDTAIRWVATEDTTNKRVNITASLISGGAGGGSLRVKEVDGAPNVSPVTTIVVSNGTLTDDGGGQVTISTGGGGSGITRISSTISVSSTFAAASQTDYVAFANVGIAFTLPTAIGNSNLYTVKNVSASSVVVLAPTGQDIDGSASALMPTNYESLSFISNGSIYGVV